MLLYAREDDGDALEPRVVGPPREAAQDKELPLVGAHADFLESRVEWCWRASLAVAIALALLIRLEQR